MPRNYQRHRFIDSLQDEERRAAENDRNPNAYMGTGWQPDTSIKGRVFRLTCALSDSQDKAIRSLKHELGSIPLEAVWPILKDICYDLGLFIGGGGAVGAVAGAVAATFATGGVGAVPGAVAGAYLGTQAGSLCMVFIGLEEVVFYLFKALPNAAEYYKRGFNSAMSGSPFAANDFADGHVLMVKAILAGIVFYLTAGKGKLPELLQKIRTSKKLGAKFATWVEQNEKILINNDELKRPNFNSRNKCIGLCANSKAQQKTEVKIVSDDDFGHRGVTQKDTGPAMTPRQLVAEKAKMEKEMAQEAAEKAKKLPALRKAYIEKVEALEDVGLNARAAGADDEKVARMLHQMRRDLGEEYKNLTPPEKLKEIYARNLDRYGDKLGPSVDWLRAQGKSWEQIIQSSFRTGGKDLGF